MPFAQSGAALVEHRQLQPLRALIVTTGDLNEVVVDRHERAPELLLVDPRAFGSCSFASMTRMLGGASAAVTVIN
jgi:hypothetical protein